MEMQIFTTQSPRGKITAEPGRGDCPRRSPSAAVFDNYFSVRCGDDNFMTVF